jgi:hypothetical protein
MKSRCKATVFINILIILIALTLTTWRGHDCLERYLQFHRGTVVKMLDMDKTIMPALTICPSYGEGYKKDKLNQFGISGFRDYRNGNIKGNSSMDERSIYAEVTHSVSTLFDEMKIDSPGKPTETLYTNVINTSEIRHLTLGKCFEIRLDQFGRALSQLSFTMKMHTYVYINIRGQFHNLDL